MTHGVRFAAALALIGGSAWMCVARAQAPSVSPEAASAAKGGDSQGPAVTFQVEVDYVDVDVVVTDQEGNFVRGLTRDDFEVIEDGKPVKIDTFSTVQIPVERYEPTLFGGKRTSAEDVRSNRSTLAGRFYVIVLDDVGTSPLRSQYVIKAARQFVEQHFAANDTAAIVYTSGRRDRAQDFTSDGTLLLASIDKFMGTKLRSSTLDKLDGYYMQKLLEEGLAAQNNGEPVDDATLRNSNPFSRGEGYPNRSYDQNDIERGQRALGVLGQIKNYADFLTNVRGRRKAMVLFSEGIDYPTNDIFASHDATTVLGAMQDAIAAAARANVNIFTVDPRGLVGLTSEYIELNQSNADLFNIGARDPRYGMQPQTALLAEMRLTQDSLRTLSEETGGLASIDANSFSSAFNRIVDANSQYYMLGYYPPNHPRDGKFHKIDVRVRRPGLRVLARRGYASPRARTLSKRERDRVERERIARTKGGDQTSSELRAMLDSPIQQGGVVLQVQAAPFRSAARTASVALAIEIDGSRLQFAPQKETGIFANVVELSLFGINAQGKPLQGIRTAFDLTLRPDTHERVKQHGLRANPRIELPPGRYQLRIGVRESGAGEMGTVFYDLDVPDFAREPLSMSGLLVTAPSAQRAMTVQPDQTVSAVLPGAATSRRAFSRSDELGVYAEIYAQMSGEIAQRVDVTTSLVSESGKAVFVSNDELSGGVAAGRDTPATYSLSKRIPLRDVAPGAYLLRVDARRRGDTDRSIVRETKFTVAAP